MNPLCHTALRCHHVGSIADLLSLALVAIAFVGTASCATVPYEPPHEARAIRVVTYNIKHGHGMDGKVDLERVAQVLRPLQADVILLQEVDQGCVRSGETDQAAILGSTLDMAHRFGPFRPYDGGLYGMAILTSLPILRSEIVELPPGPNPLVALELELQAGATPVTVVGLHLVQTEQQRLAQATFLHERYEHAQQPVILAGDLNSERNSPVLAELRRLFDAPEKDGDRLTFPSVEPVKEIDFVLLAPKDQWIVREHRVVNEAVASDHRPVLAAATCRY